MSAFLPIATKLRTSLEVRFVPIPDMADHAFANEPQFALICTPREPQAAEQLWRTSNGFADAPEQRQR